eukprot:357040-Chlamydomonas_euryale.AAC.1
MSLTVVANVWAEYFQLVACLLRRPASSALATCHTCHTCYSLAKRLPPPHMCIRACSRQGNTRRHARDDT